MDFLWRLDLEIFRRIHLGWHATVLDSIFWAFSYSGLGQVQALAILALFFFPAGKKYVVPLLTSLVVSGLVIGDSLKLLFPRDRPSNLPWAAPQEHDFFRSFPSGHTSSSFGIAVMLILLMRGTPNAKWSWIALIWAAGVGVSRIYRGVHWPTDVLAGIFVGLAGAALSYLIVSALGRLPADPPPPLSED